MRDKKVSRIKEEEHQLTRGERVLGGLEAQYGEAQTVFRGGQIGVLAKGFGADILMQLRLLG